MTKNDIAQLSIEIITANIFDTSPVPDIRLPTDVKDLEALVECLGRHASDLLLCWGYEAKVSIRYLLALLEDQAYEKEYVSPN